MTIAERHGQYAEEVRAKLKSRGIRADADVDNEKIGYKVRAAAIQKIPYMLTVGDKEMEGQTINVRRRGGENLGEMTLEAFACLVDNDITEYC